MALKSLTLHGAPPSPNPFKVNVLLKELGLPYSISSFTYADVKGAEYVAINPNGRFPALQDPNTGLTLWESGAIVEYLVETYDKDHKFSFPAGSAEAYHAKQWLYFQTTGQGPYYGQFAWFTRFHPEKLPSALERYAKEMNRVTGVLESWLSQQKAEYPDTDGPWLVGNKLSYADLSFVPWQRMASMFSTKEQFDRDQYPLVKEWQDKMLDRASVKETIAENPAPKH
jgi:glutathione S-transferase